MSYDLNGLSPEEIIELAADLYEEGMEKEASELPYGFDINELDVEDFLEFADDLADEMEKVAKGPHIKMGPHNDPKSAGIWSSIRKHYRGRETSRKAREAKKYETRFTSSEGKKRGRSRWVEGTAAAREYAPEAAVGTAAVGTAAFARSRRNRRRRRYRGY